MKNKKGWTASRSFNLDNTAHELGIRLSDWDEMGADEKHRYVALGRAKSIMGRWETYQATKDK